MADAVAEPQVAVITTLGCPYCKKAKSALEAAGIPYREYELGEQLDVLSRVKASSGQSTVPQVFVGGRLLGGASDVVPLAESGQLAALLADTAAPPLPAELQAVLEAAAQAEQGAADEAAGDEDAENARLRALAATMRPPPRKWSAPLNERVEWPGAARPAAEVSESLRKRILRLYDKHLADGGKKVNYAALKADPAFAEFAAATAELQRVDLAGLATREQRMAFFINVYNALVVHALAVFGAADGSLGRLKWFDSISYVIGGARWSSNDIEHGALRGNAPSPASLFALLGRPQWAGRTFKSGDPRAALAIKPVDPRIHFALNCGAASCPPIRIYTPDSLEFGLEAAAQAFCASEVVVDKAAGELELSMILKWYGPDFGSKAQLLQFLADHLPPGPQADLNALLAQRGADGIALRFRPYDWTTNAAE